jgi:hypothetical protein
LQKIRNIGRELNVELVQICVGGVARLSGGKRRLRVDRHVAEVRTRSHNHLFVGVHHQTDAAVFDGNIVKGLLKANHIAAERRALAEHS